MTILGLLIVLAVVALLLLLLVRFLPAKRGSDPNQSSEADA
jgi:hypothetical protein